MKKSRFLSILFILALFACNEPHRGIAHSALKEAYPFLSSETKIFSESVIRAALNLVELDSTNQMSSQTDYVLSFEMDKQTQRRNEKEDSIVGSFIEQSDAELLAEYTQKESTKTLFVEIHNQTVYDLILIDDSKESYKVYEFVGEMPLSLLLKTGINNFDEIQKLIIPSPNAGADSTDI